MIQNAVYGRGYADSVIVFIIQENLLTRFTFIFGTLRPSLSPGGVERPMMFHSGALVSLTVGV